MNITDKISYYLSQAQNKKKETKQFFSLLRKKRITAAFNQRAEELAGEFFSFFSCLECANCCKSISPILNQRDIDRLLKKSKIPGAELHNKIRIDEDMDYVFTSQPCPFLEEDNYCRVYEHRPKACREYPHTDSESFTKSLKITYNNYFICPCVFYIVEKLKPIFRKYL